MSEIMEHQSKERYLGKIVQFQHFKHDYFALLSRISSDGRFICYRVSQKKKEVANSLSFITDDGAEYRIHYDCYFFLPSNRFSKVLCSCPKQFVSQCDDLFSELPDVNELKNEYQKLRREYIMRPQRDTKKIVKKLNSLSKMINERQAVFLLEKEMNDNDKYRNYRLVPDKNGISRVYRGGSCSKK